MSKLNLPDWFKNLPYQEKKKLDNKKNSIRAKLEKDSYWLPSNIRHYKDVDISTPDRKSNFPLFIALKELHHLFWLPVIPKYQDKK